MIAWAAGKRPPHTGAATLAIRAEFYRERLRCLSRTDPGECERILGLFNLESIDAVLKRATYIVPVNITYYPVRARENILSDLARRLVDEVPERLIEELMTEGSMLLSGVDIDIRFGEPLAAAESLKRMAIARDICASGPLGFDDPIASRRMLRREAVALMQRYMASIYGMTTVNHDHLFATLLRSSPYPHVDPADLCRRVFLLAAEMRKHPQLHVHEALAGEQTHLLVDDRHGIVQDFIGLAVEKGNLKKRDGRYFRDRASFGSAYSFHRARIENPLGVMSNAVEPLRALQRATRRKACLPAFWVRRQVRDHFVRTAQEEFQTDYRQYRIEGESKPMEVGSPYLIHGRSGRPGVVLCHGYMAAPLEVRELALFLGRHGFYVYAPRLRGHGTSPQDLAERSYADWLQSVERGYALMHSICSRVVAGGFSTGAGLALHLAARVKTLAGVFAVSAPMRLRDFNARFAPAVDMWNRLMDKANRAGAKMEFVENRPENPHINYLRNPISGVREIERLMDDLEPRLGAVEMPALVVQSSRDPVVDPRGSEKIFKRIGARDKQYVLFNFDRHGILLGEGSEKVHQVICDFLRRLK
jgi:esterase/lipase